MVFVQSFLRWRDTQRSSSQLLDSLSCRNNGTQFLCNSRLLPLLHCDNLCLGKLRLFLLPVGRIWQHKHCPDYQSRLAWHIPGAMEVPKAQGGGCLWLSPANPWLPCPLPWRTPALSPVCRLKNSLFKSSFCMTHPYGIVANFPITMSCSQMCTMCKWITVWMHTLLTAHLVSHIKQTDKALAANLKSL